MGKKKEEIVKIAKFVAFSASAGVIQIVSFELLQLLSEKVFGLSADKNYWVCYLVSLLLSVVWNFTFNRKFTFKSAANVPIAMLKVFGFYAVFTPLSLWWGDALEGAGWNDTIILVLTMVVNFVTEFLFDEFVVFRDGKDKKKNGADEKDGDCKVCYDEVCGEEIPDCGKEGGENNSVADGDC